MVNSYKLATYGYGLVYQLEMLLSKKPEVDKFIVELSKFISSIPRELTPVQLDDYSSQMTVYEANAIVIIQAEEEK